MKKVSDTFSLFLVIALGCGRVSFEQLRGNASGDGDAQLDDSNVVQDASDGDAANDAATCAPVTCISSAAIVSMCNGRCFTKCADGVTQDTANNRCLAWGGTLVIPHDNADADCAVSVATGLVWLGYMQDMGAVSLNAGWLWLDTVQWPALPWASNEPNDFDTVENGQEQCTLLLTDKTAMDMQCGGSFAFVCSR